MFGNLLGVKGKCRETIGVYTAMYGNMWGVHVNVRQHMGCTRQCTATCGVYTAMYGNTWGVQGNVGQKMGRTKQMKGKSREVMEVKGDKRRILGTVRKHEV